MDKKCIADDIQVLSAGEHIRMRPYLYFEKCFNERTLNALPFEVLCHALDEYCDGHCKKAEISVAQDSFTVSYDAGMSLHIVQDGLSEAEIILTQLRACRDHKKHLAVGEAFCDTGMAIINFAAERCELTTVCKGKKGIYIFKDGNTVSRKTEACETEKDYTQIFVTPSKTLFKNLTFTIEGVNKRAENIRLNLKDFELIVRADNTTH